MSDETDIADRDDAELDGDEVGHRFGLADLIVAAVIGFLVAAAVWAAVGNLIQVPRLVGVLRRGTVPWVPLVASVAVPIVMYVGAIVAGRGRSSFDRALILVTAVAASSAAGLSLYFASLRILNL